MNRFTQFAFILVFPLFFLHTNHVQAQSADSLLAKALASDQLLPLLIDSALKYSPAIRRSKSNEGYTSANLEISKKAIFSAVSLQSAYGYGTNYSAINNQATPTVGNNLTTAQNSFYNVGVGLQLPLTSIINRKNIIKANREQVNSATAETENIALLVKQEVIRLYQDFKLSQKLVIISSKNKQAAQVNNNMAEKDFLNGQITVDKVSGVLESYNKSIIEFETYVAKFQTSYMMLEAYTGTSLSSLIMQVK